MEIDEITDFPALQQLARALWGEDTTRGAAVLVGAGFSRNAERSGSDTLEPPLWSELAKELATRLYPNNPNASPTDVLRLAEEFRTYFGQTALDEFVRTRIRDLAWQPGALHRALLDLPWSDVLTTNWDTLLERAAGSTNNDYCYEPVRSTTDLAHARAPRIVKLHGSLGTSDHFIIAEEDYRTYPVRFAAFVNFARQVFIENELCLIGFSGDDPNFLQWSGWVRDNLGSSSRRIYLVGSLKLSQATRKYLEARNVAPIDLASLVNHLDVNDRHAAATERFLDFLAKSKPSPIYNWKPAEPSAYAFAHQSPGDWERQFKDDGYAASLLDQTAKIWRSDRESYPGWLVCPVDRRRSLLMGLQDSSTVRKGSLDKLSPTRSAEILYELAWRYTEAYRDIDQHLTAILANIADPTLPCGLEKRQQLEIAVALLRAARRNSHNDQFDRWSAIIEKHAVRGTDLYAELAYQRAIQVRDRLDFVALDRIQETVEGPDPIWRIRRASLLCELGKFAQGERLIKEALAELNTRQRQDRKSLWVLSRRVWAEWLARAFRQESLVRELDSRWPLEFREARCDPENEIESIANEAAELLRKRREEANTIVPLFEAGYYKDPSSANRLSFSLFPAPLENLKMLTESIGLPIRLRHFNLIGQAERDALDLAFQPSIASFLWFLRTADSVQDARFGRYFSRIAIAQLPAQIAAEISERLIAAIGYWQVCVARLGQEGKEDALFAVERLRLCIEALARLTVRQDANAAFASFDLAMKLGQNRWLRHWCLFEPIGNLAKFSGEAIPPSDRARLVLPALEFPLSNEVGVTDQFAREWPNPLPLLFETLFETPPDRPIENVRWRKRILELIESSAGESVGRAEAVLRLTYLAQHSALSEAENVDFGKALWSKKDAQDPPLPLNTGLLSSSFAELPAPSGIDPKRSVHSRLFDVNIQQVMTPTVPTGSINLFALQNCLVSIAVAARRSLRPTAAEAIRIFHELVSWRPYSFRAPYPAELLGPGFLGNQNKGVSVLIGEALAQTIIPSISPADLTGNRARALLELISQAQVHTAIAALPYFALADSDIEEDISQRVRRAVAGPRFDEVASGASAIETWAELDKTRQQERLPRQLVGQIISAIETRREIGLHTLLHCAQKLLELGRLTSSDIAVVCQALGDLLVETAYDGIDPDSRAAVSVSLIRANCVRLARELHNCGSSESIVLTWLDAPANDPLPEVRFA